MDAARQTYPAAMVWGFAGMKRPWLKFYPSDWRGDPRLRMCSLAARGLWIDLISYMHEGEPYGHLTIDGAQPDLNDIASLVARPAAEVRKSLAELEAKQVFSRDESGQIYSRRMVRDNDRSEEGREQIGKRWANRDPNRDPNSPPNRSADRGPTDPPITYMLDKKERKKDAASAAPIIDQDADLFRRGKEVLGNEAGSLIAKLKKAKNGSIPLTRAAIEQASIKQNPREYIGAVLRGATEKQDDFYSPTAGII